MKKLVIVFLLMFLIVGCAKVNEDMQSAVDETVQIALSNEAAKPVSRKPFYSYYTEPSIGNISSSQTNNVFSIDNVKFIMNLNISRIVSLQFYKDQVQSFDYKMDEQYLVATSTGTYVDYADNENAYSLNVYMITNQYYVILSTQYMDFYGVGSKIQALDMIYSMMNIAKSIKVDSNKIVASYSSKETLQSTRKALDLFNEVVPSNGQIEELFIDNSINQNNNADANDENYSTDNFGDSIDESQYIVPEEPIDSENWDNYDESTQEEEAQNQEVTAEATTEETPTP